MNEEQEQNQFDDDMIAAMREESWCSTCEVLHSRLMTDRAEIEDRDKRIVIEEEVHARAIGRAEKAEARVKKLEARLRSRP